jgi:mannose-6-phosphate isomerase-like protein (cupin superfamily)
MNAAKKLSCEAPESIGKGVSIIAVEGLRPGPEAPVGVLEFNVEPYAKSAMGANPVTEVIRVLSGAGLVLAGDQKLPVQAGDWVLIGRDVQHQVCNEGAEVLRALSVSWVGKTG